MIIIINNLEFRFMTARIEHKTFCYCVSIKDLYYSFWFSEINNGKVNFDTRMQKERQITLTKYLKEYRLAIKKYKKLISLKE